MYKLIRNTTQFIILFAGLLSSNVSAKIYYDQNLNIVHNPKSASFYLNAPLKSENGHWPCILFYQQTSQPRFIGQLNHASLNHSHPVGAFKIFSKNGELSRSGQFTADGQLTGLFNFYYPNGVIAGHDHYKNGQRVGLSHRYFSNGQLRERFSNKAGMRHGEYLRFNLAGNLILKRHYSNGKIEGLEHHYFSNGQEKSQISFKNGHRDGEYYQWTKNGTLAELSFFKQGEQHNRIQKFAEDGFLTEELHFNQGKMVGQQRFYYPNGRIKTQKNYDTNGQLIQTYQYNQQGHIIFNESISYKDELATISRFYFQDELLSNFHYIDQEYRIEIKENFNQFGQVIERHQLKNNQRSGLWLSYHHQKEHQPSYIEQINYQNNKVIGDPIRYTLSGEKIKLHEFVETKGRTNPQPKNITSKAKRFKKVNASAQENIG